MDGEDAPTAAHGPAAHPRDGRDTPRETVRSPAGPGAALTISCIMVREGARRAPRATHTHTPVTRLTGNIFHREVFYSTPPHTPPHTPLSPVRVRCAQRPTHPHAALSLTDTLWPLPNPPPSTYIRTYSADSRREEGGEAWSCGCTRRIALGTCITVDTAAVVSPAVSQPEAASASAGGIPRREPCGSPTPWVAGGS